MRHAKEVIEWNTYSAEQKSNILERLDSLISKICEQTIVITDPNLLEVQCKKLNVRYRKEFNPLTWAYMLLKTHSYKIDYLEHYGFAVRPEFCHLTLTQLITLIDLELLKLSAPV
jgi:hypothetical protein